MYIKVFGKVLNFGAILLLILILIISYLFMVVLKSSPYS